MKLRALAVPSLVLLALPLLAEQAAEVAPKIPVSAARAIASGSGVRFVR
jgi:hypothetical protein